MMIGAMESIILLQFALITNVSDLVTGNFFGPLVKSVSLLIMAGMRL